MIQHRATGKSVAQAPAEIVEPRDRGSSIVLVLTCLTAIALFATVALTASVNTLKKADSSDDWNQALAAAEAGVSDYVARLNKDDQYWQRVDCSNQALKGPKAAANSCGWNASTPPGWLKVPSSQNASFHYDVSTETTYSNGVVLLTSTGKVGSQTRTVESRVRRGGFGEFLYYTVYETSDPANETVYGISNSTANTYCPRYNWPSLAAYPGPRRPDNRQIGASSTPRYCNTINFISGDVINGPMHTNDAFVVSGNPRFKGTTTTSNPSCRASSPSSCYLGSGSPIFERGISYREEVELPTSLGDLRQFVDPTKTPTPGCLYTGPTRIKFLSSGQMQVWSKYSTAADLNPGCGSASALSSTAGATVAVPTDRLIYVQDVPASRTNPTVSACKTTTGGGGIGDNLPIANDINMNLAESSCRYGNVWVQGTLKGRTTISVDNNIIVTGDLTYAGGRAGTDVLGLVAKNSVRVYHPVNSSGANLTGTLTNVQINAAILTLQHSFSVQYYDKNQLGTLSLFGSFAQRFRGAVGTGSHTTGYLKDYNYDTRLRYAPPPYFLDPVRAGWGQKTFAEVRPRY